MKVHVIPTSSLCWIEVSNTEALLLIKSLTNQLLDGPNSGRLESKCTGDIENLSIAVRGPT